MIDALTVLVDDSFRFMFKCCRIWSKSSYRPSTALSMSSFISLQPSLPEPCEYGPPRMEICCQIIEAQTESRLPAVGGPWDQRQIFECRSELLLSWSWEDLNILKRPCEVPLVILVHRSENSDADCITMSHLVLCGRWQRRKISMFSRIVVPRTIVSQVVLACLINREDNDAGHAPVMTHKSHTLVARVLKVSPGYHIDDYRRHKVTRHDPHLIVWTICAVIEASQRIRRSRPRLSTTRPSYCPSRSSCDTAIKLCKCLVDLSGKRIRKTLSQAATQRMSVAHSEIVAAFKSRAVDVFQVQQVFWTQSLEHRLDSLVGILS